MLYHSRHIVFYGSQTLEKFNVTRKSEINMLGITNYNTVIVYMEIKAGNL